MDLNFIFKWAADAFFSQVLPGKKTLILAWLCKIWGVLLIAMNYMPQACEWVHTNIHFDLCGLPLVGTFMTVLGVALNICRWCTKIYSDLNPDPDPFGIKK